MVEDGSPDRPSIEYFAVGKQMSPPTSSRQVAAESLSASANLLCPWQTAQRTGLPVAWSRCFQRLEIRHAALVISNQYATLFDLFRPAFSIPPNNLLQSRCQRKAV